MKFRLVTTILAILTVTLSSGQTAERITDFPDIPGFITLKTDFHIHSVFSDGSVWPDIRVMEAVKDGLDAISLTEHLEYQPHIDDIPHPNRNRAYELALEYAKNENILIVPGSEITRDLPPGHANALFITDANKLVKDNAIDAFEEAKKQGAFVFWNHPNWIGQKSDGVAEINPINKKLIDDGLLHGIEIANEVTFSEEAMQLAIDHDLTMMGTSDIHGLVDWKFDLANGGHRPITLVFAKERNIESIKEALFAGRTATWFNNILAGKTEYLQPLVQQSMIVKSAKYIESYDSQVLSVQIENSTDVEFVLKNLSDYTLQANIDVVQIMPNGITTIEVKTLQRLDKIEMQFEVLNALAAPGKKVNYTLKEQI